MTCSVEKNLDIEILNSHKFSHVDPVLGDNVIDRHEGVLIEWSSGKCYGTLSINKHENGEFSFDGEGIDKEFLITLLDKCKEHINNTL